MESGQHPKILIVDDDPAILRLLSRWLSHGAYELFVAPDGQEAIACIQQNHPDIIITDWNMPRLDGIQLCQWVRSEYVNKYVYVLFLSVRSGSDDMIQALEAGADDFLRKPIDKNELLARLRAATRVLELESRLSLLANTDSLTGLSTQRNFYQSLEEQCQRAQQHETPLACVKIDVDRFRQIKDVHGHRIGDEVVRRVGRTIVTACRATDVVARYGEASFSVLLADTNEENAVVWADRIRCAIGSLEFAVARESLRISVSCGAAQFSPDMQDNVERLVQSADEAMLVAKGSGRDRVVGFQSLSNSGLEDNDEFANRLASVTVADVMTTVVASLRKDMPVISAANYFLRFRIPSAPVVDEQGKLVGVLSERDVMGVMLWPDWETTRVEQIMTTNVVTYEESTPAMQVYEYLCQVSIRAVIIVEDGCPTGVLSRSSLVRWFINSLVSQINTGESSNSPTLLTASPKETVANIALALRTEADHLTRELPASDAETVTAVVAGASRMQELVNDLLAVSASFHGELMSM